MDAAEGNALLEWIEGHAGLASWVQAIGSVLAIASGFGVAWWQTQAAHHRANAESRARAHALALLIRDDITTLRGQYGALDSADVPEAGDLQIADFIKDVPRTIADHLDQMYLLGSAGNDVMRVVSMIYSNKSMLESREKAADLGNIDFTELWELAFELAERGLETCVKAESSVDAFLASFNAPESK